MKTQTESSVTQLEINGGVMVLQTEWRMNGRAHASGRGSWTLFSAWWDSGNVMCRDSQMRVRWFTHTTKGRGLALAKQSQRGVCCVWGSLNPPYGGSLLPSPTSTELRILANLRLMTRRLGVRRPHTSQAKGRCPAPGCFGKYKEALGCIWQWQVWVGKSELWSGMTTSILLDYHDPSKGLGRRELVSPESTGAQGKASGHLGFILTRLSSSLRVVKNSAFVRQQISPRNDGKISGGINHQSLWLPFFC